MEMGLRNPVGDDPFHNPDLSIGFIMKRDYKMFFPETEFPKLNRKENPANKKT